MDGCSLKAEGYGHDGKKISLSNKEQRESEVLILGKFDSMKLDNYERIFKEKQSDAKSKII